MIRDVNQKIIGLKGEQMKDGNEGITLGSVIVNALLAAPPNDQTDGKTKALRYALAMRVNDAMGNGTNVPADLGKVDFSIDDLTVIKEQVGKAYGALVVGRAYEMLEQKKLEVAGTVKA